jgi:hypothetical protein
MSRFGVAFQPQRSTPDIHKGCFCFDIMIYANTVSPVEESTIPPENQEIANVCSENEASLVPFVRRSAKGNRAAIKPVAICMVVPNY